MPDRRSQRADNSRRDIQCADHAVDLAAPGVVFDGLEGTGQAIPSVSMAVLTSQDRSNGPARAAAILALQQTHDNRTVQRLPRGSSAVEDLLTQYGRKMLEDLAKHPFTSLYQLEQHLKLNP